MCSGGNRRSHDQTIAADADRSTSERAGALMPSGFKHLKDQSDLPWSETRAGNGITELQCRGHGWGGYFIETLAGVAKAG